MLPKIITIRPITHGYLVNVGCCELPFSDGDELLDELRRYLMNPEAVEKEYLDAQIYNNDPPALQCTEPSGRILGQSW